MVVFLAMKLEKMTDKISRNTFPYYGYNIGKSWVKLASPYENNYLQIRGPQLCMFTQATNQMIMNMNMVE